MYGVTRQSAVQLAEDAAFIDWNEDRVKERVVEPFRSLLCVLEDGEEASFRDDESARKLGRAVAWLFGEALEHVGIWGSRYPTEPEWLTWGHATYCQAAGPRTLEWVGVCGTEVFPSATDEGAAVRLLITFSERFETVSECIGCIGDVDPETGRPVWGGDSPMANRNDEGVVDGFLRRERRTLIPIEWSEIFRLENSASTGALG